MLELLPCPFCGGKAETNYRENPLFKWRHRVICSGTTCGAEGPVATSRSGAIKAWNRHTLRTHAAGRAALATQEEKQGEQK